MKEEILELAKLNGKLDAHIKSCGESRLSYAALQKMNRSLENFYKAKKELEENLKDFLDNKTIEKIEKQGKEVEELLNYFKTTDVAQRLQDIETEIAILKEGGNI